MSNHVPHTQRLWSLGIVQFTSGPQHPRPEQGKWSRGGEVDKGQVNMPVGTTPLAPGEWVGSPFHGLIGTPLSLSTLLNGMHRLCWIGREYEGTRQDL